MGAWHCPWWQEFSRGATGGDCWHRVVCWGVPLLSAANGTLLRFNYKFVTVTFIQVCWMRLTRCGDEHLIALSAKEASTLLDAAVLIAVAVDSVPDVSLPAEMATLVGDLFSGLSKAVSKEESISRE